MNNLTTCTSPSGNDSVNPKCPAHTLAAVVPPDWKQFVEACAEVENCTVNISAIARRAKKLLGGSDSGVVPHVALPDGWKLVPVEPTEAMVLAPGAVHTIGRHARIHRDVWARMLAAAPAPPAAQDDAMDAARYRWLTEAQGLRLSLPGSKAIADLTEMNAAIDAAIASKRTGP